MLEQLFGSRTRVKLMRFFLANPGKSFFVRELTRKIGEQINSVRRELINLGRIGLVRELDSASTTRGKKYYQVNQDFALYGELRDLMIKARMMLENDIVKLISSLGQIQFLAFCGLFCDDAEKPTDILIVGRINRSRLDKLLKKMSLGFEREINYTIMSRAEFDYRRGITDKFLCDILDGEKIAVINKL